jgi:hypothetical protein
LYDNFVPYFTALAQEANKNCVGFTVKISPDGDIKFKSTESTIEKNKIIKRTHAIIQGRDYVMDESKTERED